MLVGMTSLGMGRTSLRETLAFAAQIGCQTIELNGRPTVHQAVWQDVGVEGVRAQLANSGLKVGSLGGYSSLAQPDDALLKAQVAEFVGYCRTACTLGIPVVRAFAGDVVPGVSLEALYPRMVAGFRTITTQIDGWAVCVGIENHGRLINQGDWLSSLIHDVASPRLGITLDTGNFCWAGASIEQAERWFEKLLPVTVSVHVKDGRFVDGEWTLLPAGRGDFDLAGLIKRLAQCGYTGQVVSEYEGTDDFEASTAESVAYLRGIVDGVCA